MTGPDRPIADLRGLAAALCDRPEWGEGPEVEQTLSMCVRHAVDRVMSEDPYHYAGVRLRGSVRLGEGPPARAKERWEAAFVPSDEDDGVRVAAVRGPGGRWSSEGPYEIMAHLGVQTDGKVRDATGFGPVKRRQLDAWREDDDPRIRKIRRMGGTTVVRFEAERATAEPGATVVGLVVDLLGVPEGADPHRLLDEETSPWWEMERQVRMVPQDRWPSWRAVAKPLTLPTTESKVRKRMGGAIGDAMAEWAQMRDDVRRDRE